MNKLLFFIFFIICFVILFFDAGYSVESNQIVADKPILKIFIVHSYDPKNNCTSPQKNGFLDGINELSVKYKLNIQQFYMGSRLKYKTDDGKKRVSSYALTQIDKFKPDYLFFTDDNAFEYVGINLLQKGYKIFVSGLNKSLNDYKLKYHNITQEQWNNVYGVEERINLTKIFELFDDVNMKFTKYYILTDSSETSQYIEHNIELYMKDKNPRRISVETVDEMNNILNELNKEKEEGVILVCLTRLQNDDGTIVDKTYISKIISVVNKKHLELGFNNVYLGFGLMVTCGPDFYEMGYITGVMMSKYILYHEQPKFITDVENHIGFNLKEITDSKFNKLLNYNTMIIKYLYNGK